MKLTPYHTLLWQKSFGSIIFFLMKHLAQLSKCPWWRLNNFGPSLFTIFSVSSLSVRTSLRSSRPTAEHPIDLSQREIAPRKDQANCGTPHWLFTKENCTPKGFVKLAQVWCTPNGNCTRKDHPNQFFTGLVSPRYQVTPNIHPDDPGVHPISIGLHPGRMGCTPDDILTPAGAVMKGVLAVHSFFLLITTIAKKNKWLNRKR